LLKLGPFVDADHPSIQSCEIDKTFDELLDETMEKIKKRVEDMETTRAVIIPSTKDAAHMYVFPQPPYLSNQSEKVSLYTIF
jgi:hypothetical protein